MTARRWRFAGALAGAMLLAAAPSPAQELPVLALGEWRVVALDGGLFIARSTPYPDEIQYVFGTDGFNRKAEMKVLAAAPGTDLAGAIESLGKAKLVSDRDSETLQKFAKTFATPTTGKSGEWKALTSGELSELAIKSDVDIFTETVLRSIEANSKGDQETASISAGYCKAATLVNVNGSAVDANAQDGMAAAVASDAAQGSLASFTATVAAACADVFPTYPPTAPPAWPLFPAPATPPPGWNPPSGPGSVVWVGGACTGHGNQAQCVNREGELCMCTCEGAGATGIWTNPQGCNNIPRTTPAVPPAAGSPCTPPGGIGPCGNECACSCTAPPAGSPPGTPSTWGTPTCGSREIALAAGLLTLLFGAGLRQRRAVVRRRR